MSLNDRLYEYIDKYNNPAIEHLREQTSPIMIYQNRGRFGQYGLTLIQTWISNYIHYKRWAEITYSYQTCNGCTVGVWE